MQSIEEPRRFAVETIRREHRALSQVLELLRELLRRMDAGHAEPDFHLLSLALHYIDDFPCRLHHPKEDRYLFAAIRRHTHAFDAVIAELDGEHDTDSRAVLELHRLLVRLQAGADGALPEFREALDRYAHILYGHMRKEETVLDDPRLDMPQPEWQAIAQAFATDGDPLFGPEPRREFDLLHRRIVTLLPGKMRHTAARDVWPW